MVVVIDLGREFAWECAVGAVAANEYPCCTSSSGGGEKLLWESVVQLPVMRRCRDGDGNGGNGGGGVGSVLGRVCWCGCNCVYL